MKYTPPGKDGSIVSVLPHYDNFIGGKWMPPTTGQYRTNLSPATAAAITEIAHSAPVDVELALDAAHAAAPAWRSGPRRLVPVLLLRAVIMNGDFEAYWRFHLQQQHQRTHTGRYQHQYDLAA